MGPMLIEYPAGDGQKPRVAADQPIASKSICRRSSGYCPLAKQKGNPICCFANSAIFPGKYK